MVLNGPLTCRAGSSCWFTRPALKAGSDVQGSLPQAQCVPSHPVSRAAQGRGLAVGHPGGHSRILELCLFLNHAPHYWDSETGENDSFTGKGHTNQVSRMTVDEAGQLVSCSMDDTVRYTNLMLRDYR